MKIQKIKKNLSYIEFEGLRQPRLNSTFNKVMIKINNS